MKVKTISYILIVLLLLLASYFFTNRLNFNISNLNILKSEFYSCNVIKSFAESYSNENEKLIFCPHQWYISKQKEMAFFYSYTWTYLWREDFLIHWIRKHAYYPKYQWEKDYWAFAPPTEAINIFENTFIWLPWVVFKHWITFNEDGTCQYVSFDDCWIKFQRIIYK